MSAIKNFLIDFCEAHNLDPSDERNWLRAQEMIDSDNESLKTAEPLRFKDLKTGDFFVFASTPEKSYSYEYRGNGWYGIPYSGGPWHQYDNPPVILRDKEQGEREHAEIIARYN